MPKILTELDSRFVEFFQEEILEYVDEVVEVPYRKIIKDVQVRIFKSSRFQLSMKES